MLAPLTAPVGITLTFDLNKICQLFSMSIMLMALVEICRSTNLIATSSGLCIEGTQSVGLDLAFQELLHPGKGNPRPLKLTVNSTVH